MPSLRKRSFIDATGNRQRCDRFTVRFRDDKGIRRELPGFKDRAASETMGRRLEELATCRAMRQQPGFELSRWIEGLPDETRDRLAEFGLLTRDDVSRNRTLTNHIADFLASVERKQRNWKTIDRLKTDLTRMLSACRWTFPADIEAARLEKYLDDMTRDGSSARTRNYSLTTIKQFIRWMIEENRMQSDPIRRVKPLNAQLDRRRTRRALDIGEQRRLIASTLAHPERRYCLTGQHRAAVYSLSLSAGLRLNEIRSLTRADIDLNAGTVTIRPENEKSRRGATLPLPAWTVTILYDALGDGLPLSKPFAQLSRGSDMLSLDLGDAGIPREDDAGNVCDFHALRHSFGTSLARAGVPLAIAQKLMRHSTPELTSSVYTHLRTEDFRTATETMPDLTPTDERPAVAVAGMAGAIFPAPCTDPKSGTVGDRIGRYKVYSASKNEIVESEEFPLESIEKSQSMLAHPEGFEPPTVGLEIRCAKNTTNKQNSNLRKTKKSPVPATDPNCQNEPDKIGLPDADTDARKKGENDPVLQAIIDRWDGLPVYIRAAIIAMIKTID